jgi:cation/acetate symporter
VILTGRFMLCYVIFGGMVATTWVQIIKAVLLMAGILAMSIFVLARSASTRSSCSTARREHDRESTFSLGPGTYLPKPLGHRLARPRAGARHRRPAAHPDAVLHRAERQGRALVGRRGRCSSSASSTADHVHRLRRARVPGRGGVEAAGKGGNLAAPNLAAFLGGGEGTFGGDLFLAVIAGVAFATILAVVAGLVLARRARSRTTSVLDRARKGKDSEHEEVHGRADRRASPSA